MTDSGESSGVSIKGLLRENALALMAASGATLLAVLGLYLAAWLTHAPASGCLLAALAAGTIWVAVAAPLAAAGGRIAWGIVLRAGVVADAAGAALLLLWLGGLLGAAEGIAFASAVRVYCVYAVMALAAAAALCAARSPVARHAVALAAAVVLLLAAASPFWINGLLDRAGKGSRQAVVDAAVTCNPFYAVTASVRGQTRLVWHQAPVLYTLTRIGEYTAPAPTEWYSFIFRCGGAGLGLAAVAIARNRRRTMTPAAAARRPGEK